MEILCRCCSKFHSWFVVVLSLMIFGVISCCAECGVYSGWKSCSYWYVSCFPACSLPLFLMSYSTHSYSFLLTLVYFFSFFFILNSNLVGALVEFLLPR